MLNDSTATGQGAIDMGDVVVIAALQALKNLGFIRQRINNSLFYRR
jgi:hypothetical protein